MSKDVIAGSSHRKPLSNRSRAPSDTPSSVREKSLIGRNERVLICEILGQIILDR